MANFAGLSTDFFTTPVVLWMVRMGSGCMGRKEKWDGGWGPKGMQVKPSIRRQTVILSLWCSKAKLAMVLRESS